MSRSLLIALVGAASLVFVGAAMGSGITNAGDDLRTGWYPDEAALSPQVVGGGSFGQLWSATVNGQVYAQPLLTASGTLVVATENDKVYGLDAKTGTQQWFTDLGTPFNPADIGCGDITPSIGTTATPVIDPTTNTVYLTHKTYVSGVATWFMDALDATTGQQRSGWPVKLSGTADNAPSVSFATTTQQQRPGLLLMNGVVYAAFGSHCDVSPWRGWVFGVSTTAHNITARWLDNMAGDGNGIWQAGVGLTSDGSGSILLSTGNGISTTTPTPGSSPPATLGESVVRLRVQADGTLKAVDFFEPFDATQLDQFDADFGSGGVVGLPDASFGTASTPHLAVAVGKQGYVYLLNRDNLGGYDQGSGGGDNVVQRLGPRGGVWGRPGVWPGDGGYVYIPTSSGQSGGGLLDVYKYGVTASGAPSLSLVASSPDVFGWGSGSPVITSDSTKSGTALVWIVWSADRSGTGGQLRAYDPIPVGGAPHLRFSAAIGRAANYSTPGVGDGRIYVGTRDGKVLAYGSPVTAALTGSGLSFPTTTIGSTSQQTMTLTATRNVQISNITSSSGQFTLGTPSPSLPASLNQGQTISIPVTFAPTQTGTIGGEVDLTTTGGPLAFSLAGTGQAAAPDLEVAPAILSLGGTTIGNQLTGTVTFSNAGNAPLTINQVQLPGAPFSAPTPPANGDTISPGASVTVDVSFSPTSVGSFSDQIGLVTNGGSKSIGLSAAAGAPGLLAISSESNDYGSVPVGTTATKSFSVTNMGGSTVTITKSKPPFGGDFAATTTLQEGTTITPGQTLTETVAFTPTSAGPSTGAWQINSDDGSGVHTVQFTGTGTSPSSATTTTTTTSTTSSATGSGPPTVSHPRAQIPVRPTITPAATTVASTRSLLVTYAAAVGATTKFSLQRAMAGRRTGQVCVRLSTTNRGARTCIYFGTVARFAHLDVLGTNRLRLTSQVPARTLVPGTYRLQSVFTAANGIRYTFYTFFRITPAPLKPAARHATPRHSRRGR